MSEDDRVSIARLEERVIGWMNSTDAYRNSLCEKMAELKVGQTKIFEMLYDLPCKERSQIYKDLKLREKLLWGAVGMIVTVLIKHLVFP
mgnify:CR=1 FL=1